MGETSLPKVNAQLLPASGEVKPEPYRLLINGQIGTDGNAVSGATYSGIESLTNAEVIALFGTKSELTNRILKTREVCLQRFSIWVIALDAAAGTGATNAIVYAGTATEDKVMTVNPISQKKYSFDVIISNGDTAADVATAVKAGIDALNADFPATNALVTETLTLTATDFGTIPNKYTVEHLNLPAGITVNGNTQKDRQQFSSGATDPVTTTIFDNVTSTRFHAISWPWESDFDDVKDFLEPRNVVDNAFLQGVAFIGYNDTEANITAKVNGTTPLNSPNLVFMGNRNVDSADVIIEPADWVAVNFLAIEGLRLTEDVPIGQYVTVSSPLDTVGGPGSASLAYYNTPLANVGVVLPDDLFDATEQGNLLDDGYTIVGVNPSVTSMIMGEVVSTYKLDSLGNSDVSFKYLNYIRTGFLALEVFFRTLKSSYSQSRLTQGDLVGGRAIATKEAIEAEYSRIYQLLSGPDYVLTQAGAIAESTFFKNLTITLDVASGKVTSSGILPIVTQIREFNMTFQLSFTIGG